MLRTTIDLAVAATAVAGGCSALLQFIVSRRLLLLLLRHAPRFTLRKTRRERNTATGWQTQISCAKHQRCNCLPNAVTAAVVGSHAASHAGDTSLSLLARFFGMPLLLVLRCGMLFLLLLLLLLLRLLSHLQSVIG